MQRIKLTPKLNEKDKTLVVDGRYLVYRTKFSRQVKLSYGGLETGVYYGFFNTLQSIANQFQVTNTFIAWDISKDGIRNKEYDGYKKRETNLTPDELEERRKFEECYIGVKYICAALGFAFYQIEGYEADDVIALWCKTYNKGTNIIVTRDEDMYQLLDDNTVMYDPENKKVKDKAWFEKKYKIPTYRWAEYKSIAGCKSDTVPGIPGMGEKRTLDYLQGKDTQWEAKIEQNKALQMLCYNLVVLPHPSLNNYWLPYKQTTLAEDEFIRFCQEFGMKSFMEKIHNFYIFM